MENSVLNGNYSTIDQLKIVLKSIRESFQMLKEYPKLYRYFIPFILISFIFGSLILNLQFFNQLLSEGVSAIPLVGGPLSWIVKGIGFAIVFMMDWIRFFIFALLSTVLALLSESVEEKLTGKSYPFNLAFFIRDLFRGIWIGLRCFMLEMVFLLIWKIICPSFLEFLTPAVAFLLSSFFFGYALMDYVFERLRLKAKNSEKMAWKLKTMTLSIGAIYSGLTLIPVFGMAFIPPFLAIVVTIGLNHLLRLGNNPFSVR